MASTTPYTKEIEHNLIRQALEGDEVAWDMLIGRYEKRVRYLAERLSHKPHQIKDLVQEGRIALMESIETFDPAKGFWLWAWACRRVCWKMWAYLENETAPIHFSRGAKKKRKEIQETWKELSHRHVRVPSDEEIAEILAFEENPDFASLEEERQKDILEREVRIVREVLYREIHSLEEDMAADLSLDDEAEMNSGSGLRTALSVDRMKQFQGRVHACLKDPVRANKWLILAALRQGDDDLYVRNQWDMIADDLREPDADVDNLIGTEPSAWHRLRRFHVLEDIVPEQWQEVYEFFRYGKDRKQRIDPLLHYATSIMEPAEEEETRKVSVQNLRKFFSRRKRELLQCYPDGLLPE